MTQHTPKAPPASAAHYGMNILAVAVFWIAYLVLRQLFPEMGFIQLACWSLLLTAIPLWLYDLAVVKVYLRQAAGLQSPAGTRNWARSARKWAALIVTMGVTYLYYLFIHTLFDATYLKPFLSVIHVGWPLILLLSGIYVVEIDRRQIDPYDEYWRMGGLLTGDWHAAGPKVVWAYVRSWFVKGFFLPYVFIILVRYLESLSQFNPAQTDFLRWHFHLLDLLYAIDILFAVLGYIFTCRLLDTHIRSTDPTLLGWMVCLMCYGPFHAHVGIGLFIYDDGLDWFHWFDKLPIFFYFYAAIVFFLTLVYALATVAIGYRMSNLTYRGLITNGPYRHTKHPAYLAKVSSWWLISVPFLSTAGEAVAIKHTLALLFISVIYYLRAKTEENHLSNYPEYVAYAQWIDDHGAFKTLKKMFPALRYSPETHKRWGSILR